MNDLSHPDSKRGRLQRACLEMMQRHDRDGALPTNGRFIFYELEGLSIVSKVKTGARRPGQDVGDALLYLREVGLIPWEWIVDETREMEVWHYADSIAEYLLDTIPRARIDLWEATSKPTAGGAPPGRHGRAAPRDLETTSQMSYFANSLISHPR